MKKISIIRERGQLTIPESIRNVARWTGTSSVVLITLEKPDQITVTPHTVLREFEWEKLRELISKSRSIKGRGTISASEFLIRDRGHS